MNDPARPRNDADCARLLLRGRETAALGVTLDGAPYVSLVLIACDSDGSPLMMLSDLAQHTRSLAADGRVSLMVDDTTGLADPLTGSRLTVLGHAERCDDARALARYVGRHPSAAFYVQFADFHLYKVTVARGHFVAGFGRIHWLEADALTSAGAQALAEAEEDILAHMNADHAEAIDLYARKKLGLKGEGWAMTGIDPDGLDLRRETQTARLDFDAPILSPGAARKVLAALAQAARG